MAESGLVEDERRLATDEHRGHAQATLLALAEGEGVGFRQRQKTQSLQPALHESALSCAQALRPTSAALGGDAEGQLFEHRVGHELVLGVLEHVAHPVADGPAGHAGHVLPLQEHRPRRSNHDAAQKRSQRGLAGSVLAHDGQEVVLLDGQRYIGQSGVTVGIAVAEVLDPQQGRAASRAALGRQRRGLPRPQAGEQPRSGRQRGGRLPHAQGAPGHLPSGRAQGLHQFRGLRSPHAHRFQITCPLVEGRARVARIEESASRREHQDRVYPFDDLIELVLDDDESVSPVGGQPAQQSEEFHGGVGIEIGGGLVEHQHPRAHGQHRGDGDPLLFAPRQGAQEPLPEAGQSDGFQRIVDGRLHLERRPAKVLQAEGDLILNGERAELGVGILKDQAGLLGQQMHRGVPHHQPRHHDLARVVALDEMRDESIQAQREGALARAAGTEYQHGLPRPEREVQVDERRVFPRRIGEGKPGSQYGRRRRCRDQILRGCFCATPSPERTPVRRRAWPRACERPPPSTRELRTVRIPATRMLPQV